MQLENKHLEAIKYRLEKQNIKATYGQIREAAQGFETLDLDGIADRVAHDISFKSSQIVTSQSPIQPSAKFDLVRVEASTLGITLADSEVLQIIDSVSENVTDTALFMVEVREALKEFLYLNRQETKQRNDDLIGSFSYELVNHLHEQDRENARVTSTLGELFTDFKSKSAQVSDSNRTRLSAIKELFAKANKPNQMGNKNLES